MPIYEYKCQKCEKPIEVMQKISDPAPATCPSCGAENSMERLVSRTSFQLKGGGWYSDLYGSTKKDSAPSGGAASTTTPAAAPATTPAAPAASPAPSTSGGSSTSGSGTGGTKT